VLAFGALLGAAMSFPATAFATENSSTFQTQVQPGPSNPAGVVVSLVGPVDPIAAGRGYTVSVTASGGGTDVLNPGVSFGAFGCFGDLQPSGAIQRLAAGQAKTFDCPISIPAGTPDPMPVRATFKGIDAATNTSFQFPTDLQLRIARPRLAWSDGHVSHQAVVDGTAKVTVDWTVYNTGNVTVNALFDGEPRTIEPGASDTVTRNYDVAPGSVLTQSVTVTGTDPFGQSVDPGTMTVEAAVSPISPPPSPDQNLPTSTVPTMPILEETTPGSTSNPQPPVPGNVTQLPDPQATTGASVNPLAPTAPPTTSPIQTPSSDPATSSTEEPPTTDGSGDAVATAAPTTTTQGPTDVPGASTQTVVTDQSTGGTEPQAGEEQSVRVPNPSGAGNSLSWSTRVATIAGGALFGLALAGFGWVYVSATQGIGRVRRKP
jgi:hypothetical protein